MAYVVSAINASGAASFRQGTPLKAVAQAIALIGAGMTNVTITAPTGTVYTPERFEELYRERQSPYYARR